MLSSFFSFSKAIFVAPFLLCVSASAFASEAMRPCTDADLVEQGKDPAFNNVIRISMEKPDDLSHCSAVKVRIPSRRAPLYLTAAHCLDGFSSVWNHEGGKAVRSIVHPFYTLNPLADMGFIEFEGETTNDGYLIYEGDVKSVSPQFLISVGYSGERWENALSPRRAFYAGQVVFDEFSINQRVARPALGKTGLCTGVTGPGDSGGPLFIKREDGTYEIIGITSQALGVHLEETQWALVDSHFVASVTQSLESVTESMLKKSGKTWAVIKQSLESHSVVQYGLGSMYKKREDYRQAFDWYMKAAGQGHPMAQYDVAAMYESGRGVKKNFSEALKWYTRSAHQGFVAAQYNLGIIYSAGKGIDRYEREAIKWLTLAAHQGFDLAQYNVGFMYANGQGVPQNYGAAIKFYALAANQGNPSAQNNLGGMYAAGHGVEQDFKEAVKWYKKAANQGYAPSQYNLGVIYAQGRGVEEDFGKALKWLTRAADQGHESAKQILKTGTVIFNKREL